MLDIFNAIVLTHVTLAIITISVALCASTARYIRERRTVSKALSYCRRDADGVLYVMDPQKGTWHRLDNILAERAAGKSEATPRQRKKIRRQLREVLGAR